MLIYLLASLPLLPQGDTVAQQSTAMPASPAVAPKVDKPVCRRETPTGSNFSVKVCHTVADWRVIDQQNGANTEAFSRARSSSGR